MTGLAGRRILYTGAAGGLGFETTLAFLEAGAAVVAVDNDRVKLAALEVAALEVAAGKAAAGEAAAGEAAAGEAGRAARLTVAPLDLADHAGLRTALDALQADIGGFDIVINNAAIYPSKPFDQFTLAEFQAVQRINVDAAVVCVQAALPHMRAQGWGRIVNVASVTVSGGWANLAPYVASKAALIGLTRAWAREFGAWGVTVNCVSPGAFPTDAEKIHPDPAGYAALVLERQAVKRRGSAQDIANAVAFFASDASGFVTGQTLNVDGGWVMN